MEKYLKINVVGKGAFGVVQLCLRKLDQKLLIIKEISMEEMTAEERNSTLNEVKILKVLRHPNIIQYYENFVENNALMIAMEYAQGGTLHQYIQKRLKIGPLSENEVLHLFVQIVAALHHIHYKNILHRDLKTENILLDSQCKVCKVSDFGISKVLDTKTKAFTMVGTPCYLSPELCNNESYNKKSDIWALGCMLYELMALKRAFEAANLSALVKKIVIADYNVEKLNEGKCGSWLVGLMKKMLEVQPDNRPSIEEVMAQPLIMKKMIEVYANLGQVEVKQKNIAPGGMRRPGHLHPTSSLTSMDTVGSVKSMENIVVYVFGGGISTPMKLPLPYSHVGTQIVQVAAGRTKKACVTDNGRLIVWESSTHQSLPGSLGDSQSIPTFVPRFLEGQSGVNIKLVSCGDMHMACLTGRGLLMTMGSGSNGCLGHGNLNDQATPKIVEKLIGNEVTGIACGSYHVLAVTSDNEVFSWGKGDNGRLGLQDHSMQTVPTKVVIPDTYEPVQVFACNDGSAILTQNKMVLACGNNAHNRLWLDAISNGEILREVKESNVFAPIQSDPIPQGSIYKVSLGMHHSAVITDSGDIYMVGSNQFGQLAKKPSKSANNRIPQLLSHALDGDRFVDIGCGGTFTVGVTANGSIYTWGKSLRGQLGRPLSDPTDHVPTIVEFSNHTQFKKIVSLSTSLGTTLVALTDKKKQENKENNFRNSWDTNTWVEEGSKFK